MLRNFSYRRVEKRADGFWPAVCTANGRWHKRKSSTLVLDLSWVPRATDGLWVKKDSLESFFNKLLVGICDLDDGRRLLLYGLRGGR